MTFQRGDSAWNVVVLPPETEAAMVAAYLDGRPFADVRRIAGRSGTWTKDRLRQLGVRRTRAQTKVLLTGRDLAPRKAVRPEFVATWTPASAWFWGLFLGDGWIARTQCCLSGSEEVLCKVKVLSGCTATVIPRKGCSHLHLGGAWLQRRVRELFGLGPGPKSYKLVWPKVPEEVVPHLIRGLVDSDGGFTSNCNKGRRYLVVHYTSCSRGFVESVRDAIVQGAGVPRRPVERQSGGTFIVRFHGRYAQRVGAWLYAGADDSMRYSVKYERWKAALLG